MASIYRDKKSGYWYINYITPDGRRVRKSLGTKDRKLAELALKDFEVQLAKGKLVEDLITIITSFTARIYGVRSQKFKKIKEILEDEATQNATA